MRSTACLLLLLAVVACGPDDGASSGPKAAGVVAPTAPPGIPCVECGGTGYPPRGAPERPCLLCNGDGTGICPADRNGTEEGACPLCDGQGRCPGCVSGVAKSLPGVCSWCVNADGRCAPCGGRGSGLAGDPCPVCTGSGTCAECLGGGRDRFAGSGGLCRLCRGHGRLLDGEPVEEWPSFRLRLVEGVTIEGRLLEPPVRTLSLEHEVRGRIIREAWLPRDVDPLCWLAALARTAETAKDHLAMGRFAFEADARYLPIALVEFRHAGAATWIEKAERKMPTTDAPPVPDGGSDLDDEVRRRMREAQRERFLRGVRRASGWRAIAARRLSRTDATVHDLARSARSAEEAIVTAAQAANRAPVGIDTAPARAEIERARHLRVRALVAIAHRILKTGTVERARSVAAIALEISPDDEGARRFAAAVDEALARKEMK